MGVKPAARRRGHWSSADPAGPGGRVFVVPLVQLSADGGSPSPTHSPLRPQKQKDPRARGLAGEVAVVPGRGTLRRLPLAPAEGLPEGGVPAGSLRTRCFRSSPQSRFPGSPGESPRDVFPALPPCPPAHSLAVSAETY